MTKRIAQLVGTYFLFVLLFVLQKPAFMAYNHSLFASTTVSDWFAVVWHGLPLDLSIAGYLTIVPALLSIISVWTGDTVLKKVRKIYFSIAASLMAMIFIIDLCLYQFWGFRLDATPLFYFFSSPKDAFASVGIGYVLFGIAAMAVCDALFYAAFYFTIISRKPLKIPFHRLRHTAVLLLLTAALFIPIRGGFTVSTMNLSKVYFSQNQRLNHAAINPAFSLMYSLSHQSHFDEQYRLLSPDTADKLMAGMLDRPASSAAPTPRLLSEQRPNVIMIILEGFSSHLMPVLGGEPIAMRLDSIAREGVLFTHFFANSFRTDRGLVSIISGYPAQPSTSIMKYPEKTEHLPSIPRTLKEAGYDLSYYYGGDANFTNMRSYLVQAGFENIISDTDFPVSKRLSKWGVHDDVLFARYADDLAGRKSKKPFFDIVQTSSSHEPFDVPYNRLPNKRANSFAFADNCVGGFIASLKRSPLWKNTLVILVPDHYGAYPEHIENPVERHRIPLIFTGGAVLAPTRIATYGSQIDIAATLLSQMGLPHDKFTFSKNMLNPSSPHFGYISEPSLVGIVTPEDAAVVDCDANKVIFDEGRDKGANADKARAFLQKLYDDLEKR